MVVLGAVLVLTVGFLSPLVGLATGASPSNETATGTPPPPPSTPVSGAAHRQTPAAQPTPAVDPGPPARAPPSRSPLPRPARSADNSSNGTATAPAYTACAGKGIVWGGICNFIAGAKRNILGGALEATETLIRGTIELMLQRPVPTHNGDLAVFRPPTNQPLVGAFQAWTTVGLPLGIMVWAIGAVVALASRFRPAADFATHGFKIEENLGRNFLLTIGSWWLGAFVLHLANGLILAVAPRGDQLVASAEAGVGSLLAAGAFVWFIKVAAAIIAGILFVATILSYFLCLTLLGFLSVFSGLMLFDTDGVLRTIGWFGKKGWDIFIRAAFFPLPAALILGAGTFVAGGTTKFVESAIAGTGLAGAAGMIAFAAVMFVTLLTALLASLWMAMGARGASTAAGVVAALGGAALYAKGKHRMKQFARNTEMPSFGSSSSTGSATWSPGWSPGSPGPGSQWGGSLGAGDTTDSAGALGAGSPDTGGGGLARAEVATGNRPQSTAATTDAPSGGAVGAGSDAGPETGGSGVDAGSGEPSEPITVTSERDLPSDQDYQPGYLSEGEFKHIESSGLKRDFIIRQHDQFADIYDSEGDHGGIYLRGVDNDRLYDASQVSGEDWGMSVNEQAAMSREAVYDARDAGGGPR